MKYIEASVMSAVLIMSLAGSALSVPSISTLSDSGTVTLSGTIDKVKNDREFVLRDKSASIYVYINSGQSLVLKSGEQVNITGDIHNSFLGLAGKCIEASNIEVQKDLKTAITDSVNQTTGITFDDAQNVRVSELPTQGMVKLTGSVGKVSNAKAFTLKDATGVVGVTIESNENVALIKGAEVTVIGYVDNGLISKSIKATHVIVSDNALPTVGGS